METAPSIETVFQALNALFHNPDVSGKEKASVWLGELQRSVYAWQISDQLLQLNHDVESCYFAAQTMRTKIQYAFHELPATSHESLRDSLMGHCSKITQETPPVISTQLSLALADLALQMVTWKGAATNLIQKFGNEPQHMFFLLEVLTVMPEEINSRSLRLGANRRNELTDEMAQAAPMVMQLLNACLEQKGEETSVQSRLFKCLSSWFSIGAVSQDLVINSKLLVAPFQVLVAPDCSSQLHETASDCICSALYAMEDLQRFQLVAQQMIQSVCELLQPYHLSVAQEDVDKSLNYCRIFTELAESLLDVLVASPNQGFGSFQTLELLLTCVGHHQYEVAEITFNFWYRLSEHLYKVNNDVLNDMFKPYIQRLIVALCRHCQIDTDHEAILDEKEEFAEFRSRCRELIKDVVFITGSSICFCQMFENLKQQGNSVSWDVTEAALFVMSAIAKNILPEESDIVPQVIDAVLNLPADTHMMVHLTSIQLIGELCEWIEHHTEYLEHVVRFLLMGMQESRLAMPAAKALQDICSSCPAQMTHHFSGLVQILHSFDTMSLSNYVAIALLEGTAKILSEMSPDKVTEGLKHLCSIQVTQLNQLLKDENAGKPLKGSKSDPTLFVDRLAVIFRFTNPKKTEGQTHPCQPVVDEIWPVLSETCEKYQDDVRIVERCCRCIRFAIRCVGKGSASLLTPLVTQMVNQYSKYQHSCFLYLGSILVDEYGTEQGCVEGLLDMTKALSGPAFKQLTEEQDGLRNHPDTVDDLFRLCTRFVQRAAIAFLQSPVMKPVLMCAVAGCALDHREANASIMKFLYEFTKLASEKTDADDYDLRRSLMSALLEEQGQPLVSALINACLFALPSFMLPDTAEVIYTIMLIDRPVFCKWLETALKSLPPEGSTGVVTATHKQLTDFHKAVTSAEEAKGVLRSVRDFVRLFR